MAAPSKDLQVRMFRQMLLIRRFEEKCAELYAGAKIGGFLHLYIGEEAVAVGAIAALNDDDDIVTHYRDHGHALARGLDAGAVMAELCGRATGVAKGRGGSMHVADASKHMWGGYAIVGGHLPLATHHTMASLPASWKRRPAGGHYAVQIGSFSNSGNASELVSQLRAQGISAYASGGSGRSRVFIGSYASRQAAATKMAQLQAQGIPAAVTAQ